MKPIKGDALLFYDLDLRNKFDKAALHAGCPVLAGVKWTATKWHGGASLHTNHIFSLLKRRLNSRLF